MKHHYNLAIAIGVFIFLSINTQAQSLELMQIDRDETAEIVIPEKCKPEDLIIVINSSIENLGFESNMLPDEDFIVVHDAELNQYYICHERIRFQLIISGKNLKQEIVKIENPEDRYSFTISTNMARGTVTVNTDPRNSTIIFPELGNLTHPSNTPFTNASGVYKVSIVKPRYENVDTTISIPRNKEVAISIPLKPKFARLKLNLTTYDQEEIIKEPILKLDDEVVSLKGYLDSKKVSYFKDEVNYFELYEGNLIPVPEGVYQVTVTLPGYQTYQSRVKIDTIAEIPFPIELIPQYGQITVLDGGNAEKAQIFINDQLVGQIPKILPEVKVGENIIKIKKVGYLPDSSEYRIFLNEKDRKELSVKMALSREISLETTPTNAEVFINDERVGFSPYTNILPEGRYIVKVASKGYATEAREILISNMSPDAIPLNFKLKETHPFKVHAERQDLTISLSGLEDNHNLVFPETYKTDTVIFMPEGKYRLMLLEYGRPLYKKNIQFRAEKKPKKTYPVHSRRAFQLLHANGVLQDNNYHGFEAGFGRFVIFPNLGLSTTIVLIDRFQYEGVMNNADGTQMDTAITGLALFPIFSNLEWRVGGAVFRHLDIGLLGQIRFARPWVLEEFGIQETFKVQWMNRSFVGLELATRFNYVNLNVRAGQQFHSARIRTTSEGPTITSKNASGDLWISFGLSITGPISKTNQMLRLWH
jgi:hypothetical protein